MTLTTTDLEAAGWRRTPSGRYVHPGLPAVPGAHRRRLFTESEALTLLAAWNAEEPPATCEDCGSDECADARPTTPMPEVPTR